MTTLSPRNVRTTNITVRHFQPGLPAVTIEITRGGIRNPLRQVCRTTYFIGRGRDCDLVINDPQFAEVHALLLISTSGVTIRQIGNGPALVVDSRSAGQAPLTDQTVFTMGPFEFLIHLRPPIAAILDPSASLDSVSRMLEMLVSTEHRTRVVSDDRQAAAVQANLRSVHLEASVGIPESAEPPVWRHMSSRLVSIKAA